MTDSVTTGWIWNSRSDGMLAGWLSWTEVDEHLEARLPSVKTTSAIRKESVSVLELTDVGWFGPTKFRCRVGVRQRTPPRPPFLVI